MAQVFGVCIACGVVWSMVPMASRAGAVTGGADLQVADWLRDWSPALPPRVGPAVQRIELDGQALSQFVALLRLAGSPVGQAGFDIDLIGVELQHVDRFRLVEASQRETADQMEQRQDTAAPRP